MTIPIDNIFYMLTYAWNYLEEQESIPVDISDYNFRPNFFVRLLINKCQILLRRGLDHGYILESDALIGIRGKFHIGETVKKNLLMRRHIYCHYDEFHQNFLLNQIIKSTLLYVHKINDIDENLANSINTLLLKFTHVDHINITSNTFKCVYFHRNNNHYELLINLCRLIWEHIVFDKKDGKYRFKDFFDTEQELGHLFEEFVRNFYRIETRDYKVKSEIIKWNILSLNNSSLEILPRLKTDVSLESSNRKIIIEAKYYPNIFSRRFDSEKLRSAHLNQLISYLENTEAKGGLNRTCEGILLYAESGKSLSYSYQYGNHKISIKTLNLNQVWPLIKKDLIELLES